MIIQDIGRRFELEAFGPPNQSDGGYVWQNFRLKIEVHGQTFTSHDVWLTREEVSLVADSFENIQHRNSFRTDFIEPNLNFELNALEREFIVSMQLEAKPNWLSSGCVTFNLDTASFKGIDPEFGKSNSLK